MAYILPEYLLEQQVCSTCKKYLSFSPTKIYFADGVKCGRCSVPDDDGAVSVYETFAKNVVFPCVNRFEGCSQLLQYLDVEEHEKKCVGVVVKCPICPEIKGSLLYLIHHFNMIHPKEVLTETNIYCQLNEEFLKYFVHFDFESNRIILITASWDKVHFKLNCFTLIENKEERRVPDFLVELSTENSILQKSDVRDCSNIISFLNDSLSDPYIFEIPDYVLSMTCSVKFQHSSPLRRIQEFQSKPTEQYKRCVFRKIFLDQDFKKRYKIANVDALRFSSCGRKLEHSNYSFHVICDFCHNFFGTSGAINHIYNQADCYVCHTCYSRGVKNSLQNNNEPLVKLEDDAFSLINFYCKFGCRRFFRSCELFLHENQCPFNKYRFLTKEEFVKKFFDVSLSKNASILSDENVITDPSQLRNKGQILIATKENFKCLIEYEVDTKLSTCSFHVSHDYDTRKYYICAHIWEDQRFRVEYNDYTMKTKAGEGSSLCALFLKEIQEEQDIIEDN